MKPTKSDLQMVSKSINANATIDFSRWNDHAFSYCIEYREKIGFYQLVKNNYGFFTKIQKAEHKSTASKDKIILPNHDTHQIFVLNISSRDTLRLNNVNFVGPWTTFAGGDFGIIIYKRKVFDLRFFCFFDIDGSLLGYKRFIRTYILTENNVCKINILKNDFIINDPEEYKRFMQVRMARK